MLKLYYKPTCPYCQKVLAAADEMGVEFDLHDITEYEETLEELMTLSGKRQVPFLVDEERGVKMPESDDIIAYLKENYAGGNTDGKPKVVSVSDNSCVSCEG